MNESFEVYRIRKGTGRLKGKVAIVTGAAQGIGEGIAKAMAKEGAIVALWDISDKVHKTVKDITKSGSKATSYIVNVAEWSQVEKTLRLILDEFGKVDILVNNAGIARFSLFVDMTDNIRDEAINVNFYGMWNCTKAVIPEMIKREYGKIINISSVTGPRVATAGLTAYAASKGAISAFTRTLALEVAEYGITVNAILPGWIDTPLSEPMAEDLKMDQDEFNIWLGKSVPMKRMGKTSELGDLGVFLGSDESTYITGQEIIIDGGNTIQEVKGIS
ncbi:MAG: SDR family oxidoreductase [Deltaproteobacteria bacterium]|nr:MAG: SDR family oxidoreductase [Deltaproteobacteria bacterium]